MAQPPRLEKAGNVHLNHLSGGVVDPWCEATLQMLAKRTEF
jgi:hypothetical protein